MTHPLNAAAAENALFSFVLHVMLVMFVDSADCVDINVLIALIVLVLSSMCYAGVVVTWLMRRTNTTGAADAASNNRYFTIHMCTCCCTLLLLLAPCVAAIAGCVHDPHVYMLLHAAVACTMCCCVWFGFYCYRRLPCAAEPLLRTRAA